MFQKCRKLQRQKASSSPAASKAHSACSALQAEVAALEQQFDAMWTVPAVPAPPAAGASSAPFTPKYVQFDKQVSWIGGHALWARDTNGGKAGLYDMQDVLGLRSA